jgi:epoxyqueuosine reductase
MLNQLLHEASSHGDKLALIPINRLSYLKEELASFSREEELNGFQRWIVENLYQYKLPEVDFEVGSILLLALPHPVYAEVELNREGSVHKVIGLVMPDYEGARQRYTELIGKAGYHLKLADSLPLKRLAVQSGLATYGRNNITYVEGMGSYVSYDAYYTDILCREDHWRSVEVADTCSSCKLCINNCPTGAIRSERYLIDNERCLSALNEVPGEWPEWLPSSVHHTMYDCLRCQEICPMNKDYKDNVLRTVKFNEEETRQLLDGAPYDTFSDSMKAKVKLLGLEKWLAAIPRNLRMLLETVAETNN